MIQYKSKIRLTKTSLLKGKLFNFPFLKYTTEICKESVLRFALSQANSRKEAQLILGIKKADLVHYLKSYELEKDFYYESKQKCENGGIRKWPCD